MLTLVKITGLGRPCVNHSKKDNTMTEERYLREAPPFETKKWLFTTYVIVGLLISSLMVEVNGNFPDSALMYGTSGCPLEHHRGVIARDPDTRTEKNQTSVVGESVLLECRTDPKDFKMINSPEKFVIFPTNLLTCQPDGTWLQVPPVCVDKDQMMRNTRNYLTPASEVYCKRSGCDQWLATWKKVGKFRTNLERNIEPLNVSDKYEIQDVLVSFYSMVYLSVMFFEVPVDSTGKEIAEFYVEVYTDPRNQYGGDFAHFPLLEEHYSSLKNEHSNYFGAVSHIMAYTERIIVRFISKKEKNYDRTYDPEEYKFQWQEPKPVFHDVEEHHQQKLNESSRNRNNKSKKPPECPAIPTIPHANIVYSINNTFIYECIEGYKMVEPMTRRSQPNTTFKCVNGRYDPYPFPVCRKPLKNISSSNPGDSNRNNITIKAREKWEVMEMIRSTVATAIFGNNGNYTLNTTVLSTLATATSKELQSALTTYPDQHKTENAYPKPSIPRSTDDCPESYSFESANNAVMNYSSLKIIAAALVIFGSCAIISVVGVFIIRRGWFMRHSIKKRYSTVSRGDAERGGDGEMLSVAETA